MLDPLRERRQATGATAAGQRIEIRQAARCHGSVIIIRRLACCQVGEGDRTAGVRERRSIGPGCERIECGAIRATVVSEPHAAAGQPGRGLCQGFSERRTTGGRFSGQSAEIASDGGGRGRRARDESAVGIGHADQRDFELVGRVERSGQGLRDDFGNGPAGG